MGDDEIDFRDQREEKDKEVTENKILESMAGWSKIVDGSALDSLKILQSCFDLDFFSKKFVDGVEGDKFRCLFEQLLRIFLKEVCGSDRHLPLPPMLWNGQSVDLLKVYWLVRKNGGYETLSKNRLWDSVAEESGLGSGVGLSVKLIYIKYLDRLDRWLKRIVKDKDSEGSLQGSVADPSGCLMELETELRRALSEISDHRKEYGGCSYSDLETSDLNSTDVGKLCNGYEVLNSVGSSDGRASVDDAKSANDCEDNVISDASLLMEEVSNRKRKRDCDQKMLDWIVEVAKNPCNPEIGLLPERSKWKYYGSELLWKQVLLAREAICLKRNAADIRADQSNSDWLIKQRMHPSMYDDHTVSERQRCSQRILSAKEFGSLPSKKSHARACSGSSSSGTQSDSEDRSNLSTDLLVGLFGNNYSRKRVPVGPLFQANVPDWTGETRGSDSRWLGSQVWPQESKDHKKYLIERDRIGKGRQDSCGCQHPGSVECVRFHVAEKRRRVKLELGLAFHRWKFDKMGEEVARSWTKEEEKRFQTVIKSNPSSLEKSFWDEICKSFPGKSREDLVSYYFNVFLLQRRGYQNRYTPSNIDSDDEEESEFGSSTNETAKSPVSIFLSPKKMHLNYR